MKNQLNKKKLLKLFIALNAELRQSNIQGELHLVGGAVMCLVFNARPSTMDVDGFFQPAAKIRQASAKVAAKFKISPHWLNDGVKGYLSDQGDYATYLELENLKVMTANPEYLLAMKCLAMRIGSEFHDIEDIRFLLRLLNIVHYKNACEIISRYYPLERFPQKTLYALAELLPK